MAQNTDFRYDARWECDVLDCGIDTIPRIVTAHQGELGLSNAEFALVIQAFSFKWTSRDPYPSAATLAKRMGTTIGTIHNLTRSLKKKGYLERKCIDQERGIWTWNFSGLLRRALELERGEELSTSKQEGAPMSAGGGCTYECTETEAVPEEEEVQTDSPLEASQAGDMHSLGSLLGTVFQSIALQPTEDSRPAVIRTLMDLMQWSKQVGYRNMNAEISRYGVARVIELAVLVERLWRQREIRDRARYLNWMIHHRRS